MRLPGTGRRAAMAMFSASMARLACRCVSSVQPTTHLQASLAIDALNMAIAARRPVPGSLIHHSDRGVQYACIDYAAVLEAHDIQPSMSRVGNPYDNAKAESFMKTLKQEEVDGRSYRDAHQAKEMIVSFIEQVYNRQRLHSALAYQ